MSELADQAERLVAKLSAVWRENPPLECWEEAMAELPWEAHLRLGGLRTLRALSEEALHLIFLKLVQLATGTVQITTQASTLLGSSKPLAGVGIMSAGETAIIWSVDVDRAKFRQIVKVWALCSESTCRSELAIAQCTRIGYSDEYLRRCNDIMTNANGTRVPVVWTPNPDFRWHREDSRDRPQLSTEEEGLLEDGIGDHKTFYFSPFLAKLVRCGKYGSVDVPFDLSHEEKTLVEEDDSLFILGRSGTGKTSVIEFRMLCMAQRHHQQFSERPLFQLFVTKSNNLCSKLAKYYRKLKHSIDSSVFERPILEPEDDSQSWTLQPDQYRPAACFITFARLLGLVDAALPNAFYTENERHTLDEGNQVAREVNYQDFLSRYWTHMPQEITRRKTLSCSVVWMEILSLIKGSREALIGPAGFLSLHQYLEMGRRRSAVPTEAERREVYSLFEWYEAKKRCEREHDIQDVVRNVYRRLSAGFAVDQPEALEDRSTGGAGGRDPSSSNDTGRDKDKGKDKAQEKSNDKSRKTGQNRFDDNDEVNGKDKGQYKGGDKDQCKGKDKGQYKGENKGQDNSKKQGEDKGKAPQNGKANNKGPEEEVKGKGKPEKEPTKPEAGKSHKGSTSTESPRSEGVGEGESKKTAKAWDALAKADLLYVDEVQDLTQSQISLFAFLCRSATGFTFAGDTAQTIEQGVSFRFADLRLLFYSEYTRVFGPQRTVPPVRRLYLNHRTHQAVLDLATTIVDILVEFFPDQIDELPREVSMLSGPPPVVLSCSSLEDTLRPLQKGRVELELGANQAVLVRDARRQDEVSDMLGTQLAQIFTIQAAKGLEFLDVLVVNFFHDSPVDLKTWSVLYDCSKFLGGPGIRHHQKFNAELHQTLCAELKFLYVAITRAQSKLWFLEEDLERSEPLFHLWRQLQLLHGSNKTGPGSSHHKESASNGRGRPSLASFAKKSNPEQWSHQGRRLMEEGQYKQAMVCFTKSGEVEKFRQAEAFDARNQAQMAQARRQNEGAQELYCKAANMFEGVHMTKYAGECFELGGNVMKAAQLYEQAHMLDHAARCYRQVKLFDKAIEALCKIEEWEKCLWVLAEAQQFQSALDFITRIQETPGTRPFRKADLEEFLQRLVATVCQEKQSRRSMAERDFLLESCGVLMSDAARREELGRHGRYDVLATVETRLGNHKEAAEVYRTQLLDYMCAAQEYKLAGLTRDEFDCLRKHLRLLAQPYAFGFMWQAQHPVFCKEILSSARHLLSALSMLPSDRTSALLELAYIDYFLFSSELADPEKHAEALYHQARSSPALHIEFLSLRSLLAHRSNSLKSSKSFETDWTSIVELADGVLTSATKLVRICDTLMNQRAAPLDSSPLRMLEVSASEGLRVRFESQLTWSAETHPYGKPNALFLRTAPMLGKVEQHEILQVQFYRSAMALVASIAGSSFATIGWVVKKLRSDNDVQRLAQLWEAAEGFHKLCLVNDGREGKADMDHLKKQAEEALAVLCDSQFPYEIPSNWLQTVYGLHSQGRFCPTMGSMLQNEHARHTSLNTNHVIRDCLRVYLLGASGQVGCSGEYSSWAKLFSSALGMVVDVKEGRPAGTAHNRCWYGPVLSRLAFVLSPRHAHSLRHISIVMKTCKEACMGICKDVSPAAVLSVLNLARVPARWSKADCTAICDDVLTAELSEQKAEEVVQVLISAGNNKLPLGDACETVSENLMEGLQGSILGKRKENEGFWEPNDGCGTGAGTGEQVLTPPMWQAVCREESDRFSSTLFEHVFRAGIACIGRLMTELETKRLTVRKQALEFVWKEVCRQMSKRCWDLCFGPIGAQTLHIEDLLCPQVDEEIPRQIAGDLLAQVWNCLSEREQQAGIGDINDKRVLAEVAKRFLEQVSVKLPKEVLSRESMRIHEQVCKEFRDLFRRTCDHLFCEMKARELTQAVQKTCSHVFGSVCFALFRSDGMAESSESEPRQDVSNLASQLASDQLSDRPSDQPPDPPSAQPSQKPSEQPLDEPLNQPSDQHLDEPLNQPSDQPSDQRSDQPSDRRSDPERVSNLVLEHVSAPDCAASFSKLISHTRIQACHQSFAKTCSEFSTKSCRDLVQQAWFQGAPESISRWTCFFFELAATDVLSTFTQFRPLLIPRSFTCWLLTRSQLLRHCNAPLSPLYREKDLFSTGEMCTHLADICLYLLEKSPQGCDPAGTGQGDGAGLEQRCLQERIFTVLLVVLLNTNSLPKSLQLFGRLVSNVKMNRVCSPKRCMGTIVAHTGQSHVETLLESLRRNAGDPLIAITADMALVPQLRPVATVIDISTDNFLLRLDRLRQGVLGSS